MKVEAVISLKAEHRLDALLQAAGLARSTFFYHRARLARPDPQADLKTAITTAFHTAQRRYGHRRVHAVLAGQGWRVAKKTVLKLMRQLGLECRCHRHGAEQPARLQQRVHRQCSQRRQPELRTA